MTAGSWLGVVTIFSFLSFLHHPSQPQPEPWAASQYAGNPQPHRTGYRLVQHARFALR